MIRYLKARDARRGVRAMFPPSLILEPQCNERVQGWTCTRPPHAPTAPHIGHNHREAVVLLDGFIIPRCAACGARVDTDEGGTFRWEPQSDTDEPTLQEAIPVEKHWPCCKPPRL